MRTNWSTPKRNFFSAIFDLRNCLASGYNCKLVKEWNENCSHPIKIKNTKKVLNNFRNYKFSYGTLSSPEEIINSNASDFEKELSLNYKNCYGTEEAVETYYKTGVLSNNNFIGVGKSHLVNVDDMIKFYEKSGNTERFEFWTSRRSAVNVFYDFYSLIKEHTLWNTPKLKKKVWVVAILDEDAPKVKIPFLVHVINVLLYPLKYIPRKDILRMDNYRNVTFRIGDITNGFSIEFQIPKKFSF
jgi:hypothetical protein